MATDPHEETLADCLADPHRIRGVKTVSLGASPGNGLVRALTERIYGIRNRIVHGKESIDDPDNEPLAPFSPEAKSLTADVEILRFVAASVLKVSATNVSSDDAAVE